jgi:hypothetical protein
MLVRMGWGPSCGCPQLTPTAGRVVGGPVEAKQDRPWLTQEQIRVDSGVIAVFA